MPPIRKEKPRQYLVRSGVLCAVIRLANVAEVARVTFSLYRTCDIRLLQICRIHNRTHGSRIGVLKTGAWRSPFQLVLASYLASRFLVI